MSSGIIRMSVRLAKAASGSDNTGEQRAPRGRSLGRKTDRYLGVFCIERLWFDSVDHPIYL